MAQAMETIMGTRCRGETRVMRMAQIPMTVRNRPIVLRIDQLSSKYAVTMTSMSVAAARASWDERVKAKRAQCR